MREHLPIYVSWFITLTAATLTVAAGLLVPLPVILALAAVVGVVGCLVLGGHHYEYYAAVTSSVFIGGALAVGWAILYPWILVVPGLIVGHIWGEVVADYLDKPNVVRRRTAGSKRWK